MAAIATVQGPGPHSDAQPWSPEALNTSSIALDARLRELMQCEPPEDDLQHQQQVLQAVEEMLIRIPVRRPCTRHGAGVAAQMLFETLMADTVPLSWSETSEFDGGSDCTESTVEPSSLFGDDCCSDIDDDPEDTSTLSASDEQWPEPLTFRGDGALSRMERTTKITISL
eukprot:CAMPEP_0176004770 /NCGR_PEP_ID=MMETSP0120_2-20121206/1864_1 /TAXON_ID=160619 /ORGANISM="Kryptoperidinium foliaceum, Strain CCMP 1326" /LENGTH=169 /DNA_ID=CAMNT_0017337461 /DNA_START=38 /DNA_END=547 /DNA_ORIENTATION=-